MYWTSLDVVYTRITRHVNIQKLPTGEVDMIVADMSITPERKEDIAFSAPFMNLGITIMMKKPAKKQPDIFAFLTPFDTQVWIFIIVAWIS